jgi:hypothetical protein
MAQRKRRGRGTCASPLLEHVVKLGVGRRVELQHRAVLQPLPLEPVQRTARRALHRGVELPRDDGGDAGHVLERHIDRVLREHELAGAPAVVGVVEWRARSAARSRPPRRREAREQWRPAEGVASATGAATGGTSAAGAAGSSAAGAVKLTAPSMSPRSASTPSCTDRRGAAGIAGPTPRGTHGKDAAFAPNASAGCTDSAGMAATVADASGSKGDESERTATKTRKPITERSEPAMTMVPAGGRALTIAPATRGGVGRGSEGNHTPRTHTSRAHARRTRATHSTCRARVAPRTRTLHASSRGWQSGAPFSSRRSGSARNEPRVSCSGRVALQSSSIT